MPESDDVSSATRYAVMMLGYARSEASAQSFNRRDIEYPASYNYY